MKKILLSLFMLIVIAPTTNAQPSTFSKVIYDAGVTQANSLVKTFDHDYVIAGQKDNEAFVFKMDSACNILWAKKIGASQEQFNCITATKDSCYVMAGFCQLGIFCVKINSNGDTLWTKVIDEGGDYEEAFSIHQTYDNGFIIAGYVNQHPLPYERILIIKLDSIGNTTWSKIFTGGNSGNIAYEAKQTPDSGYVVIGYTEDNTTPSDLGTCLIKLTSTGNISWAKKHISSPNFSVGNDILITNNGFVCYLITSDSGIVIMKTDFSGNVLWSKNYFTYVESLNGYCPKLYNTFDKGYAVLFDEQQGINGLLLKIDSLGNLLWTQVFSLSTTDVIESSDSGFLVIGNGPLIGVKVSSTTNPQIGIIKTDSLGNSSTCVNATLLTSNSFNLNLSPVTFTSITGDTLKSFHPVVTNVLLTVDNGCVPIEGGINESKADENAIQVYPNPATDNLTIDVSTTLNIPAMIEITNIQGQVIKQQTTNAETTNIDVSALARGMYFVKVRTEKGVAVKKFIKE